MLQLIKVFLISEISHSALAVGEAAGCACNGGDGTRRAVAGDHGGRGGGEPVHQEPSSSLLTIHTPRLDVTKKGSDALSIIIIIIIIINIIINLITKSITKLHHHHRHE